MKGLFAVRRPRHAAVSPPANGGTNCRRGGSQCAMNSESGKTHEGVAKACPRSVPPTAQVNQTGSRTPLLAHDPIAIPISHVPVRRVRPRDRGNPVPPRLLARDPPVSIVVVERERIVPGRRCGSGDSLRGRRHRAHNGLERRALAAERGLDATQRRREHGECHRFARLHPADWAFASLQNHLSPFAVSMRVFAYERPPGTW